MRAVAADLEHLRARLSGSAFLKDEPGWDSVRRPWNQVQEQRPEIVVMARSVDDVQSVVRYARSAGLKVAVQSTGHGAGLSLGSLDGAVLLNLSAMGSVQVDPSARLARIEAGAVWGDVMDTASRYGLAGLAGSSPDVGVVGYCLGGGAGDLGRRYGLAANRVRSLRVVLADGHALRVDADHEPDLFWALRGGGGSFAVVTALEIELFPVRGAYAGSMFWPVSDAGSVLHTWLEWTRNAPVQARTSGRLLRFPPQPHIPEQLRGRVLAGVTGAILGSRSTAERLLEPLRALRPEIDTFTEIPASRLTAIQLDPKGPVEAVADGYVLAGFDTVGLDALLAVCHPAIESSLMRIDINHLGGAFAERRPEHGSAGVLGGDHAVVGVGLASTPELTDATCASLDAVEQAVRTWLSPRQFMNFGNRPRAAEAYFSDADLQRLRAVRGRYDTDGILLANRPLHAPDVTGARN
jgi:hypothetical protein